MNIESILLEFRNEIARSNQQINNLSQQIAQSNQLNSELMKQNKILEQRLNLVENINNQPREERRDIEETPILPQISKSVCM